MKQLIVAFALALFATGCGDPPTPTAPTAAAPTKTDTFTGTLGMLGSNVHPFIVSEIGGLKITLTSVTPTAALTLTVGTVSGPACAAVAIVSAQPAAAPQLSGTATIAGTFCVSVIDTGTLTEPVEYAITVRHS